MNETCKDMDAVEKFDAFNFFFNMIRQMSTKAEQQLHLFVVF